MYNKFVKTSNVLGFLAGYSALLTRGAPESCYMLVDGRAGLGKSSTAKWWALQPDVNGIYIRSCSKMTPHWIVAEIVRAHGQEPDRRIEYAFAQALKAVALARRPIVIDEAENCLVDPAVIESVRDITDLTEIPVIIIGYDKIKASLARHEQLTSRISAVVDFAPYSLEDVRTCCHELAQVEIQDDLIHEIHKTSGGRIRSVLEGITSAERHARRNQLQRIGLDEMRGQTIIQNWAKTSSRRAR